MNLFLNTLQSIAYIVLEPYLIFILTILGVVLYFNNKKLSLMQRMIVGQRVNSALELTLSQIVLGIIAGIVASILLSYSGIVFDENSGIELLFLISIMLMFIKPKFMCFSYSGSILGLLSIITGAFNIVASDGTKILNINILMLMSFIGILHIVEAFLVMIDGSRGAIPVFSSMDGVIAGGYVLKRRWVLLISILSAYSISSYTGGMESINTPSWWPLISNSNSLNLLKTMVIATLPFFGIIGYSTVTFTRRKEEKVISSGIHILIFGFLLVIVAQVSKFGIFGEVFVIIFTPMAHELMLKLQVKSEGNKKPIFISDEVGFSVLEVVRYSEAYDLGLRAGDKILSINNLKIESEAEVYRALREPNRKVKILSLKGNEREVITRQGQEERSGVLLVPKAINVEKTVKFEEGSFSEILDKFKKKE